MFRRRSSFKYHFSARVDRVTLREGVASPPGFHYVLVWRKGGKVAMTRPAAADERGMASFDESLSLVCTMYRETTGAPRGAHFAPKQASFTLLHCRDGKPVTSSAKALGRSTLNLAQHAGLEAVSEELALVLLHDGVPVGDLHLTLASRWLKHFARGRDGGGSGSSLVSDSGSEASSYSDAGSDTSGWPSAATADDTDADFSDAGSNADVADLGDAQSDDDLHDADTEDEMEAMQRRASGLSATEGSATRARVGASAARAARAGAPAGCAPTAVSLAAAAAASPSEGGGTGGGGGRLITIPRLRFGGKGAAVGGKAAQAALEVMGSRVTELESELGDMQQAGLKATSEAEAAEAALAEVRAELDAARAALAQEQATAAAAAAAASAAAVSSASASQAAASEAAAAEAAATATATALRDQLEATQEALRCLEAISASASSDSDELRQQLLDAATSQARVEGALRKSETMVKTREHELRSCEEAFSHVSVRAATASGVAHALQADLERESQRAASLERDAASASAKLAAAGDEAKRGAEAMGRLAAARAERAALGREEATALVAHSAALARLFRPHARRGGGGGGSDGGGIAGSAAEKLAATTAAAADALFVQGKAANEAGELGAARRAFECAFVLCPRASLLLSVGNMALRLGRPEIATEHYKLVLSDARAGASSAFVAAPSAKEVAMATRKEAEAQAALAAGECEPRGHETSRMAGDGGGAAVEHSRRSVAEQMEALAGEARRAKAAAAVALAEKAAIGAELLEQQRLQRRAKMGRIREQEKLAKLEVKLMTRQSDESEETARIREVLAAQNDQILQLIGEKEALQARLGEAEAKGA